MIRELNILQANLWKKSGVQDALYNDPDIWEFDAILIQEPHYLQIEENTYITGVGQNFELVQPRQQGNTEKRVRSCIWANKKNDFLQVHTESPDITIIRMSIGDRYILIASVYVPCRGTQVEDDGRGQAADERRLKTRLDEVQAAIGTERQRCPELEVFIAGDFNRHDIQWGGNERAHESRQGEAQGILDFIEEEDLQQLTPQGMITWERDGMSASTIDLAFASERLYDDRILCQLFENEHGSDHRAIHSKIAIETSQEEPLLQRYLLQKANWDMIRKDIAQTIEDQPFPAGNINNMQDYLQSATQMAIEKHCPKAKPSAYAKRWWTQDLTVLRKKYTRARNAARSHRRIGWSNPTLEAETKAARHDFHHEIKRKKKEHWLEFLDDTTNIWKASKYLDPSKASGFGRIESI